MSLNNKLVLVLLPLFILTIPLFHCNVSDRVALLDFKSRIDTDSGSILSSWNASVHHCRWHGIKCRRKHPGRVIELNLESQNLRGPLPASVGNLSFLSVLKIANNLFRGSIPYQLGQLTRVRLINMSHNAFEGDIPSSLRNCTGLKTLALEHNLLHGGIPSELGSLSDLIHMSIHDNNLTGVVPPSVGNLSSLQHLLLFRNQLSGVIPSTVSRLSSLKQLGLAGNRFSGGFPTGIYNLSSLQVLSLAYNGFMGRVKQDIGAALPNLEVLFLSTNNFSGPIPASLANSSGLTDIDLSTNGFTGNVPRSLGDLISLVSLNLEENQLGGDDSDLDFITSLANSSYLDLLSLDVNNFQSRLPTSVTNLSSGLTWIGFALNFIRGSIPNQISQLSNLFVFSLEGNFLTGTIPNSIGQLSNLQVLSLAGNNFTGELPLSLGNITGLSSLIVNTNFLEGRVPSNIRVSDMIDLSDNNFTGLIPGGLFDRSTTYWVNLSNNHFRGDFPGEVGLLKGLTILDVSNNRLSGKIPITIGQCLSLEELRMQNNHFDGGLPDLRGLKGLIRVDLSRNNLSGQIPPYLVQLTALQYLNLSFNRLDGEVPEEGLFRNFTAFNISGNTGLCGGARGLGLHLCPVHSDHKRTKHIQLKYILAVVIPLLIVVFILLSSLVHYRRKTKTKEGFRPASPSSGQFFPKVSYKDLRDATDGFSRANLIDSGNFGTVYRGILSLEQHTVVVAVKVLNLQQHGALKSFVSECNVLRNARHRNLLKILTVCSSVDFNGGEFRALVYEYMLNGSLERWLISRHNDEGGLSLHQRISIATDVASALWYLHYDCDTPVVHGDLKPSNVLLDRELVARVGDFGLARVGMRPGDEAVGGSSSVGVKGTIGYAAPEYGMGSAMSTQGDVYSFGILLLEMFTGKRPTCKHFHGNTNLHNFVKEALTLPNGVLEIMDRSLLSEVGEPELQVKDCSHKNQEWIECLVSMLQIGLACSEDSPQVRMKMEEVVSRLTSVRDRFLKANL